MRKSTASDRVVRKVLELVQSGRFTAGDQLPPEHELMRRLKVGRSTVREGLRALAALDIIESRHGQGSFVKKLDGGAVIRRELVPMILMSDTRQEILETRRLLEGEIAALVAGRATQRDFKTLDEIVKRMADPARRHKEVFELTWEFHSALAEMSGNRVMARVLVALRDMMAEAQLAIYSPHVPSKVRIEGHRSLLKALRAKKPERARRTMISHLDEANQIITRAVARAKAKT